MIRQIEKPPRVAICRTCKGTGRVENWSSGGELETCPSCEGSGRLVVSCKMMVDTRPYREGERV